MKAQAFWILAIIFVLICVWGWSEVTKSSSLTRTDSSYAAESEYTDATCGTALMGIGVSFLFGISLIPLAILIWVLWTLNQIRKDVAHIARGKDEVSEGQSSETT